MPSNPGITFSVGNGPRDAASSNAICGRLPFVRWSLPVGITQKRFQIRIELLDAGGYTTFTTGVRPSTLPFFKFTQDLRLPDEFVGLCRIRVELSQVTTQSVDPEYASDWMNVVVGDQITQLWTSAPTLSWKLANADKPAVKWHVQVSTTPTFSSLTFENQNLLSSSVTVSLAAGKYFFRVRQWDGFDWSSWSRVSAFYTYQTTKPVLRITDVYQAHDQYGTLYIQTSLNAVDPAAIELYQVPCDNDGTPSSQPLATLSLLDANVKSQPGTSLYRWNTFKTFGTSSAQVQITARATVNGNVVEDTWAPAGIDNIGGQVTGNLVSPQPFRWAVQLPRLETLPAPITLNPLKRPLTVDVAKVINTHLKLPYPVTGVIGSLGEEFQLVEPMQLGNIFGPTAYILGDQPSDLEAVYGTNNHFLYYLIRGQRIGGFSGFSPTYTLKAIPGIHPQVTRDAPSAIADVSMKTITASSGTLKQRDPMRLPSLLLNQRGKWRDPVRGFIGTGSKNFHLGGMDPSAAPQARLRPKPTQPGSPGVTLSIFKATATSINPRFQFLSLQSTWDALTAIHFNYNGASNVQTRVQYREVQSNDPNDWKDVQATNGTYNPSVGAWLIPPNTFYAIWDTSDPVKFPNGQSYYLRLQTYTLKDSNGTFQTLGTGGPVTILHGATNPATITDVQYEKWSHDIIVTFRIDDTQFDSYTVNAFWYTTDDPASPVDPTWTKVSLGDVYGTLAALSSKPGSNEHTLRWSAGSYAAGAGNDFRIRIDLVPTGSLDQVELPFFKWLTPSNPNIDDAEATLADLMGTVRNQVLDPTTGKWTSTSKPVYVPGQLQILEQEYERIKNDPGTDVGPSGYYSFVDNTGTVVDPSGYQRWLGEPYSVSETHGNAMARVSAQIDSMVRVQIPAAQFKVQQGEKAIRKRLMDQGYYAEAHFKQGTSGWREVVDATPMSNRSGDPMPDTAERYWRFRVQGSADGGDSVYDANGTYNPAFITNLEQTFCKFQLDPTTNFTSQPRSQPLREILYGHTGERLTIAAAFGGTTTSESNPAVDDPRSTAPGTTSSTTTSSSNTVMVGSSLKLLPALLPGQPTTDILPGTQSSWSGNYYWRVANYNIVYASHSGRPRARILSSGFSTDQSTLQLTVDCRAYKPLLSSGLIGFQAYWGAGIPAWWTSFQYSQTTTTPYWTTPVLMDFVSDRRAPANDPTRKANAMPWVPPGVDRPHPFIVYDDDTKSYLILSSKKSFDGSWRIIGSRARSLDLACEYDIYFGDSGYDGCTDPCAVKLNGTWYMYFVATSGGQTKLVVSTSSDFDLWSPPQELAGLPVGSAGPTAAIDGGTVYILYTLAGQVYLATSTDGTTFSVGNAGQPVYSSVNPISSPSLIKRSGSWIMYFSEAGVIASVWSTDAINWQGRQVELSPMQLDLGDGTPVQILPANPCAFVDLFAGNEELFLLFNAQYGGQNFSFTTMFETNAWSDGDGRYFAGVGFDTTQVPLSETGNTLRFNVGVGGMPVDTTRPVRIRFAFDLTRNQPPQAEYHRQSDWVSLDNVTDTGSYLNPLPWYYDQQLANYPYLGDSDA